MAPPVRAYGLDYSARELSPREIDDFNKANPDTPISFLVRYIGYSGNRKCISAYPGALRAHESSGRAVALVHQVAYNDFIGGEKAGIAHAKLSIADAEGAGWQWNRPVFAAYDRFLAGNPAKGITPMTVDQVEDYVGGFRSVLGDLAGLYGFYDVMGPAVRGQWTKWFWQCGAESALVPGVQLYQWNNGRVFPGGMECDLNKSYVDISSFGGDDDMALDADRDYPALLAMMQRALAFELRPGGAAPTWANGPTIYESLSAITATVAAIANDQDVTPEELSRIVGEAVERHTAKPEEIAKAMAAEVAKEVIAQLPRNEDGSLAVDIDEGLIAAEVVSLTARKLGAA